MANYITEASCRNRLRDDFDNLYELPGAQDDLTQDIEGVEGVVDSYVGKRYEVPVTDTRALLFIVPLVLDLFAERAFGAGSEIPKKISDSADTARKMLEKIASGAMTLAGATGLTERPSGGADAILVDANTPEFKRSDMEGF